MTDYYEICKMTNQQVKDAIMEAHRDIDRYDVEHYSDILLGRVEQLESSIKKIEESFDSTAPEVTLWELRRLIRKTTEKSVI